MNSEEKLLGFDAREMWLEPDVFWDQERKSTYLLRTDIDKPLSTDVLVWPSVLNVDKNLKPLSWSEVFNLWDNLPKLQEYLNAVGDSTRKPFWIIGITLLSSTLSEQEQAIWNPMLPATVPSTRDEKWSFLGYDISDMALLSGLSNCGYDTEHIQSLRERWVPLLNRFHLFIDQHQAIEFKMMTDARVPEHTPFFVYGLYLVERN